jgi:adenylate cyclase
MQMLSEYFAAMADCITSTGGTLVEFIGDAILAVWTVSGAVERGLVPAVAATLAALQMQDTLRRLNVSWVQRGYPRIVVRIGVGSGTVYSGVWTAPG